MPIEPYDTLHTKLTPFPILEQRPSTINGELHYLPLEDSMPLTFTYEHQPSKKNRSTTPLPSTRANASIRGRGKGGSMGRGARTSRGRGPSRATAGIPSQASTTQTIAQRKNFSLGQTTRTRRLVQCMERKKPRCIYSLLNAKK